MGKLHTAENDLMNFDEALENDRYERAQALAQAAQAQALIVIAQELRKLNERAEELTGYQSEQ